MFKSDEKADAAFKGIIDDLVFMSENDIELKDGLAWIDMQSRKNGVTFYEQAAVILRKHMAEKRAKEWYKKKFG